jgi:hypothetical protein
MEESIGESIAMIRNENAMEYEANADLSYVLPMKFTFSGAMKV